MSCDLLNGNSIARDEDDGDELLNSIIDIAHGMLLDRDPDRRMKPTSYQSDREWRNMI